jgi:hypothetical protein
VIGPDHGMPRLAEARFAAAGLGATVDNRPFSDRID